VALIGCLLQRDITRRYGNLKDGTADIKKHAFFHGFDWAKAIDMRGSFSMAPVTAASFSDWVKAEEVCVAGSKLPSDEDAVFATFGQYNSNT
jgi:hypothetical protein